MSDMMTFARRSFAAGAAGLILAAMAVPAFAQTQYPQTPAQAPKISTDMSSAPMAEPTHEAVALSVPNVTNAYDCWGTAACPIVSRFNGGHEIDAGGDYVLLDRDDEE